MNALRALTVCCVLAAALLPLVAQHFHLGPQFQLEREKFHETGTKKILGNRLTGRRCYDSCAIAVRRRKRR